MDYCPVCGGYLGGAYTCPGCTAAARLSGQQTQYAPQEQYAQAPQYDQQTAYAQQEPYPQRPQSHSHYALQSPYGQSERYEDPQQYGQQHYGQSPAYAGAPQYSEQPAQQQYGGADRARNTDRGRPAGHGGHDTEPTAVWHLAQQDAADYAALEAAMTDGPADTASPGALPDPAGFADPALPSDAGDPDGSAGGWYADDDEDGQEESGEPEGRGRRAARRARPRHRTLKLVLGTATGLVLAGGLVTVLPSEMGPASHSAKDSPAEADGSPSDGSSDAPATGVSVSDQDPGSTGAHSADPAVNVVPSASAHAPGSGRSAPTAPAAPAAPTHPTTTSTSPGTPTQAPTQPPAPPHQTPPPNKCVLICWY